MHIRTRVVSLLVVHKKRDSCQARKHAWCLWRQLHLLDLLGDNLPSQNMWVWCTMSQAGKQRSRTTTAHAT